MAGGAEFKCSRCGDTWFLFYSRFTLGPTQWGSIKFTCFDCLTFLEVADTVDAKCWNVWRQEHGEDMTEFAELARLTEQVESRLAAGRPLTPVSLDFLAPNCPICRTRMSSIPYGQHLMKCRRCQTYSGEYQPSCEVVNYYVDDIMAHKMAFLRGFNAP